MVTASYEVSKRLLRDFNELSFLKASRNVAEFTARTLERTFGDFQEILEKSNFGTGFVFDGKIIKKSENGCFWLINGVDNIQNFTHRLPIFGSAIALVENYDPADVRFENSAILAATFHDPTRGESFWAEKDSGTFCNSRILRISRVPEVKLVGSSGSFAGASLKGVTVRNFGSSVLNLAYLAANKLDAFFGEIENPINFACGKLILLESGGTIKFTGEKSFVAASDVAFTVLEKTRIL